MRPSFFNGLIIGAIIGVSALVMFSISNEVAGLNGLKLDTLTAPLSKAPGILAITTITISEVDRRPDAMLPAMINSRLPQPLVLSLPAIPLNKF